MQLKNGIEYLPQVKDLILEYTTRLGRDLTFQNLSAELSSPEAKYTPPEGELLVAVENGKAIGMVAYHRHSETRCEMKRLYVQPAFRRQNIGRALAEEIIRLAQAAGYQEMVLDTLVPMVSARALYSSLGFEECEPYYHNPMDDVIYLRKDLRKP